MIYDILGNVKHYFDKNSRLFKALTFVDNFDASQEDGRYEIDGDNIYALVMTYQTGPAGEGPFEAHKKYIDVQALIQGSEGADIALEHNLEITKPYSQSSDDMLFAAPHRYSSLVMKPGGFAVFYPQDIHRPGRQLDGEETVRKIVVKVSLWRKPCEKSPESP